MKFGTKIYLLMSKGYAIYLANNNRTLKVVEFPIRQYARSQQLMQFVNEHTFNRCYRVNKSLR